ncbi:MAG: HAD family phosphatase [Betaproteobacteria bacterium]|nr:HAD family phosphatase [Betaproteobacteria bacterium]
MVSSWGWAPRVTRRTSRSPSAASSCDFFDTAVGAADVRHGKPEPDIFLEAARRMDVAPEQCLVFEDAPLGIEAARRAGMRAVALTTSDPDHAFAAYAHVIHVCGDYRNVAVHALAGFLSGQNAG